MIAKDLKDYLQENIKEFDYFYDSFRDDKKQKSILIITNDRTPVIGVFTNIENIKFTLKLAYTQSSSESEAAALAVRDFLIKKGATINDNRFYITNLRGPVWIGKNKEGNFEYVIDFTAIKY